MARARAFRVGGSLGALDLSMAVNEAVGEAVIGVELSLRGPAAPYILTEEFRSRTLKDGETVLVVLPDEGKPGVFILDEPVVTST